MNMRTRGIQHRHVYFAVFFGAISGTLAIWGEMGSAPVSTAGNTGSIIFMAVLVAPIVEELAKPFGLYLILGEERPDLTLAEWTMLGCLAGLGFMILENVLYALQGPVMGYDGSWLLLARMLMPLHIVATGITGFGLGLWAKTRKASYFVFCVMAAMLIHALHNLTSILMEAGT